MINFIETRSKIRGDKKNQFILEFRVIGLNINSSPPPKVKDSDAKSLGLSKEYLENEFKD